MPKAGRPNLIKRVLWSDVLRDEAAPHEAVDKVELEFSEYRLGCTCSMIARPASRIRLRSSPMTMA
jgi:hypothetical protein